MSTATQYGWYLGNFSALTSDLDVLLGTYGSGGAPVNDQALSFTTTSSDGDGLITAYNASDTMTFDTGSGPATTQMSELALYDVTATLDNGSVINIQMWAMQSTNGDVILLHDADAENDPMETNTVVSFQITNAVAGGYTLAQVYHDEPIDMVPLDDVVDGEETADAIGLGYDDSTGATDGGGDQVTYGDDSIDGNGGDDTITGGAGSDTIDGGAGADVITEDDSGTYQISAFQLGVDFTITGGTFEGGADGVTLNVASTGTATLIDDDGQIGGDVSNETFTDANQLVIIDGQAYQILFDDTADFTNDVTGDTYTFAILDVDLDGSGESGQAGEDGTFLIQIAGPAVPDGASLTAVGGTTNGSPTPYDLTGADFGFADEIDGGAGDDTIDGGAGDDTLEGGIGSDSILGGSGNDSIQGDSSDPGGTYYATDAGELYLYEPGSGSSDLVQTGLQAYGDIAVTPDGTLYGVIFNETEASDAGIYSIDPATGIETRVIDFPEGSETHASLAADGNGGLYVNDDTTGALTYFASDGAGGFLAGTSAGTIQTFATDILILDDSTAWAVSFGTIYQYDVDGTGTFSNETNLGAVSGDTDIFGLSLSEDGSVYAYEGSGEVWTADPTSLPLSWTSAASTNPNGGQIWGTANAAGTGGGDTIDGGAGDDTIDGGAGADSLSGGDGDDTFLVSDAFGADTIIGGETGETAGDVIDLSGLTSSVTVTYSGADDGSVTDGTDTLGFSGIERLILTDQADVASVNSVTLTSYIDGGAGDDKITGSNTTAGSDTLIGGAGNDVLRGWDGSDSLVGGSGHDSLIGDQGDDTLEGGAGDDTLGSWVGAASLDGGDDSDTFRLFNVSGGRFDGVTIVGGEGGTDIDTVELSHFGVGVTVTYSGDEAGSFTDGTNTATFSEIERFILSNQADTFSTNGVTGNETVYGMGGDDTITTQGGADYIDGGDGADSIVAGQGADTIVGGAGNDYIDAQSEDDFVDAGAGNDTVLGGQNNDTLFGGAGDDSLNGQSEDDLVDGGEGNDTLVGEAGADTLYGSLGSDSISGGDGDDVIAGDDAPNVKIFGGFSEGTLLPGAGTTIGNGDTFTLPADRDVLFKVDDDDAALSGDNALNETSDDPSQIGTLTYSDGTTIAVNDTLYYESVHVVSDGTNTYLLAEIEGQSGDIDPNDADGDDVFVFVGNQPPGGASLTVVETHQDFADLDPADALAAGVDTSGGAPLYAQFSPVPGTLAAEVGGDDTLVGGAGDDTFYYDVGDGADTISDFNTGNSGSLSDGDSSNNDFIDLSGFYDDIWELHADQADDGVLNQSNDGVGGVDYSDNSQFGTGESLTFTGASADGSFFTSENTGVVCFVKGTRIRTPSGEVPVEHLAPGDLVNTKDNGPREIVSIERSDVSRHWLKQRANIRPVWISPAMTGGYAPLLVSPQHCLVIRQSNGDEILIKAAHLARMRGGQARQLDGAGSISYIHLMLERHEILFGNGAPSESFYPGACAVSNLSRDGKARIRRLLPNLAQAGVKRAFGPRARLVARWSQLPPRLNDLNLRWS